MYNKIILAGNLTRDIEIRYTQGGSAIGNTAIATSRKFKSQTGEQKEEVLFVDLTFSAQDGTKRSKHSVTVENLQMLGSRDEAQANGGGYNQPTTGDTYAQPAPAYNQPPAPQPQRQQQQASHIPEIDINEDEIPF